MSRETENPKKDAHLSGSYEESTHVQFESIHPFLDGNGRLGRLLVTFLLCAEGVLQDPLLYLSLYFKMNKSEYYDHLQRVRLSGTWDEWILFFLEGIRHTSQQGFETARLLVEISVQDRGRIGSAGRKAGSMLQIYEIMRQRPIISSRELSRISSLSTPSVGAAIKELIALGLMKEITGKKRDRVFIYERFLQILSDGPR